MFRPLFEGQKCSLGYAVIDWLEEYACHGPGPVEGQPLTFDDEMLDFVVDAYELEPASGRRLISRGVLSMPKGRAKSEVAGLIGVAEALAPVRFDGWDASGQPVGRPIRSPFVRCLATEERQSGNTFQNLAFVMGDWGHDNHPDIYGGVKGIRDYRSATNIYLPNGGECRSSSSGAASKDGGKETFLVPDEVHLYVLPELRNMYATTMRNLPKRAGDEPWALLTTTAFRYGEESVWETIYKRWKTKQLGPGWLVHHREAKGPIRIYEDREHTLAQLRYVYGAAMDPVSGWMTPELAYQTMLDPTECRDEAEGARYYLNRAMASSDSWIALRAVEDAQVDGPEPADGTPITLGFDGSLNDDSTILRGCRMSDGYRWTIGLWEKPEGSDGIGWQVPRTEVLERIREAHARYRVIRGHYDPHEWRSDISDLAHQFGEDVVVEFPTTSDTLMGPALDTLHTDIVTGVTKQSDDPDALRHYGNAYVKRRGQYRLIRKEYPNSPRKIDVVVADALAYAARRAVLDTGWADDEESSAVWCFA